MKLRVKHGTTTHRIVVDDNCSYEDFKAVVASTLGCSPAEIKGSLNNKMEITGSNLRDEGVRSGDLVWLIGSTPPSTSEAAESQATQSRPNLPAPHQTLKEQPNQPEEAGDTGASNKRLLGGESNEPVAEVGGASASHKRPLGSEGPEEAMETAGAEGGQEPPRPLWSHDDYMMHVCQANPGQGEMTCAVHAAFLEAGLQPSWVPEGVAEDVPGKFQLPANAIRLGYELLGAQAGRAACQLVLTSMADYLVVSAKTTGSPSHSLSIRGEDFTVAAGGAHSRRRELWIRLSNGVVRPVVADLKAKLGLPPPADLLGLPIELCHLIFRDLEMVDLINLTATCKELRSLASSDPLWSKLCHAEFRVDTWDEEDATRWGWMRVYKMKHVQRELARQRIEDERRLRGRRSNIVPGPLGGPFGARRPSPYHQIGGDYDWNPMLQPSWRPFLGGGGFGSGRGSHGGSFRYAPG